MMTTETLPINAIDPYNQYLTSRQAPFSFNSENYYPASKSFSEILRVIVNKNNGNKTDLIKHQEALDSIRLLSSKLD